MVGEKPPHRRGGTGGVGKMDIERLTYMANQIARNLAMQGEEAAVQATLQHLKDYWDPRMKAAILAGDRSGLDLIARSAVERLAA